MLRAALAFVVGAVVWMAAFFVLTIAVAFVWPAYRAHGRTWFESGVFTFEPPMAALNVLCWVLAAVLAGWLTAAVARRPEPVWVLAIVLEGYLAVVHLILEWSTFPWWYNLGVVLTAAPAVLLGGKLAGRLARPAVMAPAL
jgi:hypothetical protein